MKINTSELTGLALDWAVAKCEGQNGVLHDDGITRCILIAAASGVYKGIYRPTLNWSQGGPIIERECIDLFHTEREPPVWEAEIQVAPKRRAKGRAHKPLVAAMRCFVMIKLGDEVDVPEELLSG